MNYYNEYDPHAAAWLRQLIADGQIPDGHVDDRSITEVAPSDLRGYTQCHFFAGIAGWPLALRLAGWPDDRPVWTASLPCQPFSSAGKQLGTDDERHLAPVFLGLVRQCRPSRIIGEQVASKLARDQWLPGIRLELETLGYAFGAVDLCAPCAGEIGEGRIVRGDQATWERVIIGPPHIRQRLYWVADSNDRDEFGVTRSRREGDAAGDERRRWGVKADSGMPCSTVVGVADSHSQRRVRLDSLLRTKGSRGAGADTIPEAARGCAVGTADGLPDTERHGREVALQHPSGSGETLGVGQADELGSDGPHHRMVHTWSEGLEGHAGDECDRSESGWKHPEPIGPARQTGWALLPCRDGKTRRTQSGIFPLVASLPRGVVPSGDPGAPEYANDTAEARSMRLKGYGNAICADLAALFIRSLPQ